MALKASMAFTVAISLRQLHLAVAAPHPPSSVPVRDTYYAIYLSYIYAAKPTRLNKKWTIECIPNFILFTAHNLPLDTGSKRL